MTLWKEKNKKEVVEVKRNGKIIEEKRREEKRREEKRREEKRKVGIKEGIKLIKRMQSN